MRKLGSKAYQIQLFPGYFPSPFPIFKSGKLGIAPCIFDSKFQLIHILYQSAFALRGFGATRSMDAVYQLAKAMV
ncbi:MAG: hypothetical protein WC840_02160 [Candidatus Peribacteraceae bacterium]